MKMFEYKNGAVHAAERRYAMDVGGAADAERTVRDKKYCCRNGKLVYFML